MEKVKPNVYNERRLPGGPGDRPGLVRELPGPRCDIRRHEETKKSTRQLKKNPTISNFPEDSEDRQLATCR